MINYNNKTFRPVENTENGEISSDTIFHFVQRDDIVTCEYSGGKIRQGQLIGIVDKDGVIDMRYHQVNSDGEIMTGKCISTPEILPDNRIRLHDDWQWTSGDLSKGRSVIEEVEPGK